MTENIIPAEKPFFDVVAFDKQKHHIASLDLSPANKNFTEKDFSSIEALNRFIDHEFAETEASYLIGGYGETRNMYLRSSLFDENLKTAEVIKDAPRNIHLGIDIWAPAHTLVFAMMDGIVHSFNNNNNFGDYGPTIILAHDYNGSKLYSLYGHLAVNDLSNLTIGKPVKGGEAIAHFGAEEENGNWPPHLHFQIIKEIGEWEGDFPGVCKAMEKEEFLERCPSPHRFLPMLADCAV